MMHSKRLLLVLVGLVVLQSALLAAGQGEERSEDDELSFAIMVKRADEPWFQVEAEGFRQRAEELGVEAVIMDNKMDPNVTLNNMDVAIGRGVDGIAMVVPDQKLSNAVVQKANEAGIPILAIDDTLLDADGEQIAPYVGMDAAVIGRQVGEWLANYVNENGWMDDPTIKLGVAAMTYDQVSVIKDRTDASRAALLDEVSGLTEDDIYEINYRNLDAVGSFEAMQSLLTTHPDVTNWVIYAGNDEGVVGAVRALEQAGMADSAVGCGLGAGLARGEFEKAEETAFKASVYLDSAAHGSLAVDALYDYIVNDVEPAWRNGVPGIIVTRANYIEVMGE
ncbi:MAG: substrate-binding domain-containing protein [Spirochaetales bacterium]